jgi:hypothetical protein
MGARPPSMAATVVMRYVDTVDVGGIAFRISCRYPKPCFWAQSRPEFLTARAPDAIVAVTYDEDFPRDGEDTVSDAPRVRRCGQSLLVTTAYYRSVANLQRGRVAVQVAAGFGVANLMRTLAALWLLERDTVLLRAVRLGRDGSTLACGIPAAALGVPRGVAVAGWLAVTPGPGGLTTRLTPFLESEGPLPARREASAGTLWVPGGGGSTVAGRAARAIGHVLPAIWQADRRRAAVVHTLDLATRIVTALRCVEVSVGARDERDVAVG